MRCLDKVRVTNSGYLRVCHECSNCLDTLADLPTENVEIDTICFVRETELYYSWDGTSWNPTGGEFEVGGSGGGGGAGGDVAETEIDFVSSDTVDSEATTWTSVSVLTSGNKIKTIVEEVSKMFKNIRFLYTTRSHVGMIIHSTTLDSMDKVIDIYGGVKWEKVEGRFLLGQSSDHEINSTGGESAHTLTENEMPTHTHGMYHTHKTSSATTNLAGGTHKHSIPAVTVTSGGGGKHSHSGFYDKDGASGTNKNRFSAGGSSTATGFTNTVDNHTHSVTIPARNTNDTDTSHSHIIPELEALWQDPVVTKGTGGSSAHNNMPPYKTVYIWERTE